MTNILKLLHLSKQVMKEIHFLIVIESLKYVSD